MAQSGNHTNADNAPDPASGDGSEDGNDPFDDEDGDGSDEGASGEGDSDGNDGSDDAFWESDGDDGLGDLGDVDPLPTSSASLPAKHRRMMRRVRRMAHSHIFSRQVDTVQDPTTVLPMTPSVTIPDGLPTGSDDDDASTTSVMSGTDGVAANARKTSKPVPKAKATSKPQGKGKPKPNQNAASCTPSPTRSLPPSASECLSARLMQYLTTCTLSLSL